MNVMAQAHKAAKEFFASVTETGLSYAKVLQIKLRVYHREYKTMKAEKSLTVDQMFAIKHFEDCIASTVERLEQVGINDYYIAVCNNPATIDYTLLQHKESGNLQSPLGWANYRDAIRTHLAQADAYIHSYPGTCKLHAQTHLQNVISFMRDQLAQITK